MVVLEQQKSSRIVNEANKRQLRIDESPQLSCPNVVDTDYFENAVLNDSQTHLFCQQPEPIHHYKIVSPNLHVDTHPLSDMQVKKPDPPQDEAKKDQ